MDPVNAPSRDYLVLKVAAGVIIGGLVLLGIAKLCGIVIVAGTASAPAPAMVTPVATTPPLALAAKPVFTPVAPPPPNAEPAPPSSTVIPPRVAPPESGSSVASDKAPPDQLTSGPASDEAEIGISDDAASSHKASTAGDKVVARPQKLEPVPEGDRCIEGRLFHVLPNGFEQVTDGSERRYCLAVDAPVP